MLSHATLLWAVSSSQHSHHHCRVRTEEQTLLFGNNNKRSRSRRQWKKVPRPKPTQSRLDCISQQQQRRAVKHRRTGSSTTEGVFRPGRKERTPGPRHRRIVIIIIVSVTVVVAVVDRVWETTTGGVAGWLTGWTLSRSHTLTHTPQVTRFLCVRCESNPLLSSRKIWTRRRSTSEYQKIAFHGTKLCRSERSRYPIRKMKKTRGE